MAERVQTNSPDMFPGYEEYCALIEEEDSIPAAQRVKEDKENSTNDSRKTSPDMFPGYEEYCATNEVTIAATQLRRLKTSAFNPPLQEISLNDASASLSLAKPKDDNDEYVSVNTQKENIRQILIYPQGKGGLPINTEDYMCLATGKYLNDVIIDFYLKYLQLNVLPVEQREKTYIFSTHFYTTLTTGTIDNKLTLAENRHARVKRWTKNVNLFEKDFIIIPINEHSHWFLAIICYPNLKRPVTYDTDVPVDGQPMPKKKKIPADLATEDINRSTRFIKQPLILIFDSLGAAGRRRSHVIETLHDYLTCEYKVKIKEDTSHSFNTKNMPGQCVEVPQQNNMTDCGLYLLQYVEHFFTHPIRDFSLPIKHLRHWFDTIVVKRKREQISHLIRDLVEKFNPENLPLPEIAFYNR